MPSFRLNRFGGGLTDDYIDSADPSSFEVMENVYIDQNQKIVQREGYSSVGGVAVAGGNTPISQILSFDSRSIGGTESPFSYTSFVGYQGKIRVDRIQSASSGTIEYSGHVGRSINIEEEYGEILGIRSSRFPDNQKSDTNSRIDKFYGAKTHIGVVLSFDSYSRPILWEKNNSLLTDTQFTTLGLRPPKESITGNLTTGASPNTYSYIWYWHYFYTYTIDGSTYVVNGPVETYQGVVGFGIGVSGDKFELTVPAYTPLTDEETPTVSLALYRTTANSTESFFVDYVTEPFAAVPYDITDDYIDNDLITAANSPQKDRPEGLPASVYIGGGVLDDEEPPAAKFCVWANDVLWLGNVEDDTIKMVYSKPKQPHSFPGSFFHDFPDTITGMSFIDIYPIVFTANAVYRMEGITTAAGVGEPARRVITTSTGTQTPHAIVKAEDKVYWLGSDGIYVTNGYKFSKISTNYDEALRAILTPDGFSGVGSVDDKNSLSPFVGTYNSTQKRIYWAVKRESVETPSTSGSTNEIIIALDLKQDKPAVYTYFAFPSQDPSLRGGVAERDSMYYPVSIEAVDDSLLVGDSRGFIFVHESQNTDDATIDLDGFPNLTNRPVGTIFNFITSAFSFGNESSLKWVPRMIVSCKNFYNVSRNLTLQIFSINDDNKDNVKDLHLISEERTDEKIHVVRRHFPKGGLRSQNKQIGFRKGLKVVLTMADIGEYLDVTGTTVQLQNGAVWGISVREAFLYTSADGYATGTAIKDGTAISDTGTLYLAAPVDGTGLNWYIKAYVRDEKFRLEAMEVFYTDLGDTTTDVQSGS